METVKYGSVLHTSFEQGLEITIETILAASRQTTMEKPVVISLHGFPNVGKSTFGRRCRDQLYREHNSIGAVIMRDDQNRAFIYRYAQDFLFIEDQPGVIGVQTYSWDLFGRRPNFYFLMIRETTFPINSAIELLTNPYDLLISNPNARDK